MCSGVGRTAEIHVKTRPSYDVRVYSACDFATARSILRELCFTEGLCVTLEACEFIFTGGLESGVVAGLLEYPRFPKPQGEIDRLAFEVAELFIQKGFQKTSLIVTPKETHWVYGELT